MNDIVKETQCTVCAHSNVCKFKDDLLSVQKNLDEFLRSSYYNDIPWLQPIELHCANYLQKDTRILGFDCKRYFRGQEVSLNDSE